MKSASAAVLVAISVCQWICHLGEATLLEPSCGIRAKSSPYRSRIIGGSEVDITIHPWMAYLLSDARYFCAGTLITHQFVLTAAHCIAAAPNITVRLGGNELARSAGSMCQILAEDYPVSIAINHKFFTPSIVLNDIGLLKLARSVKFEDHIRPICIILDPDMRLLLEDGISLTATGWGITDNDLPTTVLQEASVTVVNRNVCSDLYNMSLAQSHLCAGNRETNTCNGDSGGPLGGVVNYYGDLRFVQYGLTSFGDSKCRAPSIYTDLSTYSGWISMAVNIYGT
ncbi:serine protease grass [Drosophila teissieri]|uniref:serine protease grass n=1 Tax=Drosophila teissieri TaxID=7243 RepID=UPI001CBA4C3A|nr:serine protease grass [Drosophila teissieri]